MNLQCTNSFRTSCFNSPEESTPFFDQTCSENGAAVITSNSHGRSFQFSGETVIRLKLIANILHSGRPPHLDIVKIVIIKLNQFVTTLHVRNVAHWQISSPLYSLSKLSLCLSRACSANTVLMRWISFQCLHPYSMHMQCNRYFYNSQCKMTHSNAKNIEVIYRTMPFILLTLTNSNKFNWTRTTQQRHQKQKKTIVDERVYDLEW